MKYVGLFVGILTFLPCISEAAVSINEIAWMGDFVSANHEWIELYNDGADVDVTGWVLSDGESLAIELTGQIAAGTYAVLERTSDDSAPGTAFVIYTGALKNSGVTLTLRRADGGIEDQVNGGENWDNLGGDNTTKETAQYTTGGWITALATPGSANTNEPSPPVTTSSDSGSGARLAEPVEREPLVLKLPGITLDLEIVAPQQVFVNQSVQLDVLPSGVGDTIQNSLKYSWNFGDTHTAQNKDPEHVFTYPGTYMLFVEGEYGRQKAQTTKEITVLPVTISLTRNRRGDVQINNDSPYNIDLSEYRLRAGTALDMPNNTWLMSRQTITIPYEDVKALTSQLIALYDGAGHMIASILPEALMASASAPNDDTQVVQYRENRDLLPSTTQMNRLILSPHHK